MRKKDTAIVVLVVIAAVSGCWLKFFGRSGEQAATRSLPNQSVAEEERTVTAGAEARFREQLADGIHDHEKRNRELDALETEYTRRQAEQQALEAAEAAAYWETRKDWVENFPFSPTYHATVTYDPDVYDVNGNGEQEQTPAFWQMHRLVENHGFLRGFHENPYRYSSAFEQMHEMFTALEVDPNPIVWGKTFSELADYHQAALYDPEEPYPFPQSGYETWGAFREACYESIAGAIMASHTWKAYPDQTPPTLEQAEALRDQMLREIPPEGFWEMGPWEHFAYRDDYAAELKPGDRLLTQ